MREAPGAHSQVGWPHVVSVELQLRRDADGHDVVAACGSRFPAEPAHIAVLLQDLSEELTPSVAADPAHD
jgi:hypothetical protein